MNKFTVVINNRNRLTTTKKMVEDLLERNTQKIWIIDNDSTYAPLLEWYDTVPAEVSILRHHNAGHWALFNLGIVDKISEDWCFYSDSDIALNPLMPVDYQAQMLDLALRYDIKKIGIALEINDIPDSYPLKEQVQRNESGWWRDEVEKHVYRADTDTTFCLIKKIDQFASLRIAGNFTGKHVPWYTDFSNIDHEEQYYISHTNPSLLTQYTKQHKEILS
jgi:glycosyltransferase involved in cell wall biosynthesis